MKSGGPTTTYRRLIRKSASAFLRRRERLDLKDLSRRHSSSPTPVPRPKGLQKGPPFFKIDDDILVIIISSLGVQDILVLRQVCKTLSSKSRLHSVWATAVNTHIISKRLPWPNYAWPLSEVSSSTLEELCLRATRIVGLWDGRSIDKERQFSRCLQRPWNSVTSMELLRSRWLLLQLDCARLELWDLSRPFAGSPADCFDGVEGVIDGFKALYKRDNHHMLLLSTRSLKTFYISTSLPHIGEIQETAKYFGVGHCVEGCSGLLDADDEVAAFSRCYDEQGAIIQDRHSGKVAVLQSGQGDPKLSHAAAIQIRSNVIVVARIQGVDIYSMDTVNEHLRSQQASLGQVFIAPLQSIPYMEGASALHASFLDPSCGNWAKLPYDGSDAIYLGVDTNILTRTIQVIYPQPCNDSSLTFQFSPPFGLLDAPTDSPAFPTVLSSWGASARRMLYLNETGDGLVLFGLSIPIGFEAETEYPSAYDRCVAWWRVPSPLQDLAHFTAFDESTGISIIAMGSGRIWIADPNAASNLVALDEPLREVNFDIPPHPDPAWPLIHPLPWPNNPERVDQTPLNWDRLPRLSHAVEQYFPSKNETPDRKSVV